MRNGLVLSGAAGKPIAMNNAGGAWALNVGGYAAVRYVNADYSDARGGRKIYAVNSTDGGHNQNWDFGAGKLWAGTTTSWTNDANWLPSGAPASSSVVLIDGSSGNMPRLTNATTVAGLSVVGARGPATLTVDMPSAGAALTVNGDLGVGVNATLTHTANPSGTSEVYRLVLDVSGSLTIASGGKINVSQCGYGPGYGPGAPPAGSERRGGAGHGGQGGRGYSFNRLGGTTYGSVTNPVALGSAAGIRRGGGAALVRVTGAASLDGTIAANGEDVAGNEDSGGGAGGSINVTASTLSGRGTIAANGGKGMSGWQMAGGGGGRVTVVLGGGDFGAFPIGNIAACGGSLVSGGSSEEPGAAGTVYLKSSGQAYGGLILANSNLTTAARTLITTNVLDPVVGDVTIRDLAQLSVYTNLTLTVYGNWSNGTANAVSGGGTVLLAGATTNTVYGNTTFDNVTCQTPGKTLKFEGGKTNTMLAGLTIAGANGSPVSLLPATAGAQWFIKVTNTIPAPPISYVVVSNSTAVTNGNGWALNAQFSTWEYVGASNSLNGNTNWSFPLSGQNKTWAGSQSTSWGNGNNWTPSGVPQSSDLSITIPAAPTNQPVLDVVPPSYSCPLTVQSGARLTLGGNNLTIGALTNAGTIIATGSETLTCLNAVDFTGGSLTAAQSTVRLAGSGPQTLTANGNTFYVLQIANTNAVTVTDGFNVRDLTFPSSSANVAFNSGFTATNVSVVVTNGATLTFTAGQTYTVRNGLVLSGAAGKAIVMNNAGGSWTLNVGGYAAVRYVSADYSDARGGRKIYAVNSTDGGHNQNWDFGAGKLWAGTTTSWTNDANWLPSGAPVSTNVVLIDGSAATGPRLTNATTIAGLVVAGASGAATLTVDMPSADAALTVTGDLGIGANATLTHTANPAGTAEVYRVVLNVSNNLTIASGGAINVSIRGYAAGYGPGTPSSHVGLIYRGGAGYGGEGGIGYLNSTTGGTTYGSAVYPTQLGSGSKGKAGGGAVIARVAGAVIHNGAIVADGEAAVSGVDGGSGSGGSINISAGTLTGSGTMSARGGAGIDFWDNGGGGGGRIAVILSGGDFSAFPAANIGALGGAIASYTGEEPGAAGTIYLQTPAQGSGRGTVTINNSNQTTAARTQIPPATNAVPDELRKASIVVTNRGAMAVTTNDRIASLTLASTNEPLNLGASGTVLELRALTVNGTNYTKGGFYTTNNWNGFASPGVNVTGAGSILLNNGVGTVFMLQ
ncbi:MAG: hypothetical protein WCG36_00755 [bacterium]